MAVYAPRPQEVAPMATEEFVDDDLGEDGPDPDDVGVEEDLVDEVLDVDDDVVADDETDAADADG